MLMLMSWNGELKCYIAADWIPLSSIQLHHIHVNFVYPLRIKNVVRWTTVRRKIVKLHDTSWSRLVESKLKKFLVDLLSSVKSFWWSYEQITFKMHDIKRISLNWRSIIIWKCFLSLSWYHHIEIELFAAIMPSHNMSEQVLKKSWLVCISNRPLPADCILIVKCLESFFISPKIEFGCLDEQIVKDFEYTLFLRLTIIFLEINHHHYYLLSRIYTSTLLLLFSWTNWRIIVISISITMTIHSRIFLIYKY